MVRAYHSEKPDLSATSMRGTDRSGWFLPHASCRHCEWSVKSVSGRRVTRVLAAEAHHLLQTPDAPLLLHWRAEPHAVAVIAVMRGLRLVVIILAAAVVLAAVTARAVAAAAAAVAAGAVAVGASAVSAGRGHLAAIGPALRLLRLPSLSRLARERRSGRRRPAARHDLPLKARPAVAQLE